MRAKHISFAVLACLSASALNAQEPSDRAKQMFERVDTDHDGTLSLAEWKAAGRKDRGFTMLDTDHDGKLTPEELRAAAAKYKARH